MPGAMYAIVVSYRWWRSAVDEVKESVAADEPKSVSRVVMQRAASCIVDS